MKYSKEWRERLGFTQLELSKLCGVSIRTVQNWDMGGNVPAASLYKLEAIENGGAPSPKPSGNSETPASQPWLEALAADVAALRKLFEEQLTRKDEMIEKLITALAQK
jgi:transcriptional regulator with XRE-family HTH domain